MTQRVDASLNFKSSSSCFIFLPSLVKFFERYQSYRADTISILKITKGNNFANNVGEVTLVNLCTSPGHALYLRQALHDALTL